MAFLGVPQRRWRGLIRFLEAFAAGLPVVSTPVGAEGIDAEPDRRVETVDVLPELAHELSGRIELKEPRPSAQERPVVADRRVRMPGARVDEDLPLRIRADARDFADIHVLRRLQQIDGGVVEL